jgi:Predicted transcriptional regulator
MAMCYLIASKLAPDACLSYHSALEYYNMYTQMYFGVYIASIYPLKDIDIDGIHYIIDFCWLEKNYGEIALMFSITKSQNEGK